MDHEDRWTMKNRWLRLLFFLPALAGPLLLVAKLGWLRWLPMNVGFAIAMAWIVLSAFASWRVTMADHRRAAGGGRAE